MIFIYQKWIYPVDKKRINEYGFGGEEVDESSIPRNTGIGFEEEDPSSIRASVTNKPQRGSKSKSKKKKKKKNKWAGLVVLQLLICYYYYFEVNFCCLHKKLKIQHFYVISCLVSGEWWLV